MTFTSEEYLDALKVLDGQIHPFLHETLRRRIKTAFEVDLLGMRANTNLDVSVLTDFAHGVVVSLEGWRSIGPWFEANAMDLMLEHQLNVEALRRDIVKQIEKLEPMLGLPHVQWLLKNRPVESNLGVAAS